MEANYITGVVKQFRYYKKLGEEAIQQLTDAQLFWRYHEENNSIALIVHHLAGNMLSRFTDFLTTDGEKPTRNRDAEFAVEPNDRAALMTMWEKGWSCLLATVEDLTADQLQHIVYIRNEGHTVVEALNRQLAHYPYHIGQIVFVAKMLTGENWKSLSIARNKSADYNTEKFAREPSTKHFTDEV